MKLQMTQLIGHRGLAACSPENTLAGIKYAADKGLKWIELDVKLSRDSIPLLCHDDTVNRTTNGKGNVSAMDYQTLSSLDAGGWFSPKHAGETIPTLRQTLELCLKLKLSVNLELKPDSSIQPLEIKPFVETILGIIKPYRLTVPMLISSFNKKILQCVRAVSADFSLGFLIEHDDNEQTISAFENEIGFYSIHLSDRQCSNSMINKMASLDPKILVYTVNSKSRALKLWGAAIDGIFTDNLTPHDFASVA